MNQLAAGRCWRELAIEARILLDEGPAPCLFFRERSQSAARVLSLSMRKRLPSMRWWGAPADRPERQPGTPPSGRSLSAESIGLSRGLSVCDVCARTFVPSIDADAWPYQSAWTTVPLCSVTILAFANHAGAAEAISGQFSVVSCQCLAMPAGVS
jgi:hypothetical protein